MKGNVRRNWHVKKVNAVILVFILSCLVFSLPVYAAKEYQLKTKIKNTVRAVGEYKNWEGVSNVSQFIGADGEFWFAYDGKTDVTVVSTLDGVIKNKVRLVKQHETFGAVCADNLGHFYVVTGEKNTGNNEDTETVFITKYDSGGNVISTVGNKGDSSISYFMEGFGTKAPFDASNCDIDINGKYLAVNYGRTMYNGHQSNSVWIIDTDTMKTVKVPEDENVGTGTLDIPNKASDIYSSHSFAQRAVKYGAGFLFASEGDAYERAFTISQWNLSQNYIKEEDVFHFWIKEGSSADMSIVNNNYAHMGDIAVLSNGNAAFTATSVKSMSSLAENENEQIFLQIFKPDSDLEKESGYVTSGERSGMSGVTGTVPVTDHGIKWITDDDKFLYRHPQLVSSGDKLILLYEKCVKKTQKIKGVYYMILDSSGNVLQDSKKFKKSASLNPCEPPVCINNCVYWVSNKASKKGKMFVYKIDIA